VRRERGQEKEGKNSECGEEMEKGVVSKRWRTENKRKSREARRMGGTVERRFKPSSCG